MAKKDAEYTKGKWVADVRIGVATVHEDQEGFHCLDGLRNACLYWSQGRWVQEDGHSGHWELSPEAIGNAHLIASAVNACISINPKNPLAVAEGMGELVKVCEMALAQELNLINPIQRVIPRQEKIAIFAQALSKITGGK